MSKENRIKIPKCSQKRFRKLLYSKGYQRNEANKVLEFFKKYHLKYYLYDLDYFGSHKNSILWNIINNNTLM